MNAYRATDYQLKAAYYAMLSREWRECHQRAVVARDVARAGHSNGYAALAEQSAHSFGFYANIAADFYRMARETMGVE